jgi:hypothetical protein
MTLRPNPAKAQVSVNLQPYDTEAEYHLLLFSASGTFISTWPLNASETQMDIQTLPGGIYVAALQKDGVIVQRNKLAVMR